MATTRHREVLQVALKAGPRSPGPEVGLSAFPALNDFVILRRFLVIGQDIM